MEKIFPKIEGFWKNYTFASMKIMGGPRLSSISAGSFDGEHRDYRGAPRDCFLVFVLVHLKTIKKEIVIL